MSDDVIMFSKGLVIFVLMCLIAIITVAIFMKIWVLTAIPIGFLFGFFLQKGNLCGASAFSEVLLEKDWQKVFGLWICIVVSMVGFSLLNVLDLVTLSVKPMVWLNYLFGGILFGVGMVFAGGCISGCLYKSATGNINSIAALIAIPLGIALVEYGPLKGLNESMKTVVTKMPDGGPLSLPSITGVSYGFLAIAFAIITTVAVLIRNRKNKVPSQKPPQPKDFILDRIFVSRWKPWQAGLAIGILAIAAYMSSSASGRNYPLGVTHGVLYVQVLITDNNLDHIYQEKQKAPVNNISSKSATPKPEKKVVWWLVFLVTSLMLGSFISARLSGTAKFLPKPPEQTVIAILGGFLVGTGAAIAKGCVIGNIVSGWALMSIGTVFFAVVVILSNWITTYLYLMGGEAIFFRRK